MIPTLLFAGTFGAVWYDQHETYRRGQEALARRVDATELALRQARMAETRLAQFHDESVLLAKELDRLTAAVPPRLGVQEFLQELGQAADSNAVKVVLLGSPRTGPHVGARWAGIDLRLLGSRDAIARVVDPVVLPRLAIWCESDAGEGWVEGRISILALPEPPRTAPPIVWTAPVEPPGLLWPWPYGTRARKLRARLVAELDTLAGLREVVEEVEQFRLRNSRLKRIVETVRSLREEVSSNEGTCSANYPEITAESP